MSVEFILSKVLPPNVRAVQTNRTQGVSQGVYAGFNLGGHVHDDPHHVVENRRALLNAMEGCQQLHWLKQVHSTKVHSIDSSAAETITADASVTGLAGQACVVMTADCLPILFWANDGSEVAAAHAGWRGLLDGVIESTLGAMKTESSQVSVWLGPAIGPQAFEVGDEVRQAFSQKQSLAQKAFTPSPNEGKWLADLHTLARERLSGLGIATIYADTRCTYSAAETFFSYRREGVTGRMASAIWIESSH